MAYNEQASKAMATRLRELESKLRLLIHKVHFEINNGGISAEEIELVEASSKVRSAAQELEFLIDGIANSEKGLRTGDVPENVIETVTQRLDRNKISAERKTKSAIRIEKEADQTYNQFKNFKGRPNEEKDFAKKNPEAKPDTPTEKFSDITKELDQAVKKINESIPAIQRETYDELMLELRNLDLNGEKIKATVKNLSLINSIKNKLNRIILTDGYKSEVKDFAKSFNEIATLQNDYWRAINKEFKPKAILQAIKEQAITDTVSKLTEAGIGANVADPIADILRTNITAGGSYKDLTKQLRESLVNTETPGTMEKYVGQITTDAVNQYSNQYTQIVSSDLGYEWFKYDNTDILTTRPFCDAMTDRPYFHISEVPALLRAEGLTYLNKKTGQREPVMIYEKTGLPSGMIPGTDASNFFIRRGGYRCGHSIRPVNERQVPQADKDRVYATSAYKAWKSANS